MTFPVTKLRDVAQTNAYVEDNDKSYDVEGVMKLEERLTNCIKQTMLRNETVFVENLCSIQITRTLSPIHATVNNATTQL